MGATSDTKMPLDDNETWHAAVDLTFSVTDFDETYRWLDRYIPSPLGIYVMDLTHNSFGKDPSRLCRNISYNLDHLMLSLVLPKKSSQTVATFKWEGISVSAASLRPLKLAHKWQNIETTPMALVGKTQGSLTSSTAASVSVA